MLKQIPTIGNKIREFLWGLTMVILVSLFTYTVVKIFTEKSDKKYQVTLEKINTKAEVREASANKKIDSLILVTNYNYQAIGVLQKEIGNYNTNLNKYNNNYKESSKQLKQIKDEKNYVPDNVTANEQSTYISKYKYEVY